MPSRNLFHASLLALALPVLTASPGLAGAGAPAPETTQTANDPAATPTAVEDEVHLPTTFLDVQRHESAVWARSASVLGTEAVVFRWRTSEAGAAVGRWSLVNGFGLELAAGQVQAASAPGANHHFSIDLRVLGLRDRYRLRLEARDASGDPLGDLSPVVELTRDAFMSGPIEPALEIIRAKYGVPALTGAIIDTRGIVALGAVGRRRYDTPAAVLRTDSWHLGSNTKAMTATLVGILAQRREVPWELTVEEAFPGWDDIDPQMAALDLKDLLAHRSGIIQTSAGEDDALTADGLTLVERRRQYARLIVTRAPGGVPTVNYNYLNANFLIAAAMLESVTGKSWEQLIQDELFGPLGMLTAGFDGPGIEGLVTQPWGHRLFGPVREASQGDAPSAMRPSGGVHASLQDWARFIRLHLTGREGAIDLEPATLAELQSEYPPHLFAPDRCGWGWGMSDDPVAGRTLAHNGSNVWWYARVETFPEAGFAVVAVTNVGGTVEGWNYGDGDVAVFDAIEFLYNRHVQAGLAAKTTITTDSSRPYSSSSTIERLTDDFSRR